MMQWISIIFLICVSKTLNLVCILLLYGIEYTFAVMEGVCINIKKS